jgi:DNA-binding NarL/FixJ family response regulator
MLHPLRERLPGCCLVIGAGHPRPNLASCLRLVVQEEAIRPEAGSPRLAGHDLELLPDGAALPAPSPAHEKAPGCSARAGERETLMPSAPTPLGVVVIGGEPLMRRGIVAALESHCAILGAVGSMQAGKQALAALRPPQSVLILDPPLADASLEEACATLIAQHPATSALVLLREPDGTRVRLACRHGARGVFDTTIDSEQLAAALTQIADGEVAIQSSLVRYLIGPDGPNNGPSLTGLLTGSQLTAIRLLAHGYTSKEIALSLGTTVNAVDHAIERATQRLGATHRAHTVVLAMRLGLIA